MLIRHKKYRNYEMNSSCHFCLILIIIFFVSGGLFDLAESKQEVAFRYAVERVNANRKILSQSLLSAIIEKIPPQDSFHASKRGTDTAKI